jgi:hypothetical protein
VEEHPPNAEGQNYMTDSDENSSTDEDRFGRQDNRGYSGWSSAVVIIITIITVVVVGIVFAYVAMHS